MSNVWRFWIVFSCYLIALASCGIETEIGRIADATEKRMECKP